MLGFFFRELQSRRFFPRAVGDVVTRAHGGCAFKCHATGRYLFRCCTEDDGCAHAAGGKRFGSDLVVGRSMVKFLCSLVVQHCF